MVRGDGNPGTAATPGTGGDPCRVNTGMSLIQLADHMFADPASLVSAEFFPPDTVGASVDTFGTLYSNIEAMLVIRHKDHTRSVLRGEDALRGWAMLRDHFGSR
ncbi:MAG: hypothetical protein LC114_14605 [Bryobacterales bacterium]|nr:hypothetical protein [Bryobacterales bacterium]